MGACVRTFNSHSDPPDIVHCRGWQATKFTMNNHICIWVVCIQKRCVEAELLGQFCRRLESSVTIECRPGQRGPDLSWGWDLSLSWQSVTLSAQPCTEHRQAREQSQTQNMQHLDITATLWRTKTETMSWFFFTQRHKGGLSVVYRPDCVTYIDSDNCKLHFCDLDDSSIHYSIFPLLRVIGLRKTYSLLSQEWIRNPGKKVHLTLSLPQVTILSRWMTNFSPPTRMRR